MQELNLPAYSVKLKTVSQQSQIFDEVRKKWLVLTPEEWVRQHWIYLLHKSYGFPLGLISVEKQVDKKKSKKTSIRYYLLQQQRPTSGIGRM